MKIAIVGHGYVGLVTAAVFADLGNTVYVVGRTKEKIDNLNRGITPFYEPGLSEMVKRNLSAKRLYFSLDFHKSIPQAEVVFIAVGTPPKKNGEADLSAVFDVADDIGKTLGGYTVVVTKSTVPPGTNRKVGEIIKKVAPIKTSFDIASAPEFLREGSALHDTLHPDRVVLGVESEKARKILVDLHQVINGKTLVCEIETAEMIKYASNSLLSTKISFANAMAYLCEKVGADVEKVLEGVGFDRRLGRAFLYPGVGYGGSCFPKDVKALIAIAHQFDYDFELLKAVDKINELASKFFTDKIIKNLKPLKGKTIGILGLAFKPNTDDMREAPAIKIIETLKKQGAKIKAYDPVAIENTKKIITQITYSNNAYNLAKDCDAIVVLTEWNEFRQIDLGKIKSLMHAPYLFDGRNIYDPQEVKNLGFYYFGVGRS